MTERHDARDVKFLCRPSADAAEKGFSSWPGATPNRRRPAAARLAALAFSAVLAMTSSLGLLAPLPLRAAGIPVFDAAAVTQMITELMQLMKEYDQLEREFNLLADTRGDMVFRFERAFDQFEDVMQGTTAFAKANLTTDYDAVFEAASGASPSSLDDWFRDIRETGGSGLPHAVKEIYRTERMGERCERMRGFVRQSCQRRAALRAVRLFSFIAGEKTTKSRRADLAQMLDSIQSTTTQKQIADMQARLAQEEAAIANERVRLQQLEARFSAEEALLEEERQQALDGLYLSEE